MQQMDGTADTPELEQLYRDFDANNMAPLWTQRDDLMPITPAPAAVPHVWRWKTLFDIAERSGELVPVGRGGERRAIGLMNPGLPGTAYATPTLWCAIQYLGGYETAPEHRHSQNAFRFVVEGEGVWTVVNGDPVRMSRGDLLLTPGWNFHGHHNDTAEPMAWIDGLDIPFSNYTDVGFFEFGSERVTDEASPQISRAERLWAHPGLRPLSGLDDKISSPLSAYRWEYTDAALREQLALEDEGYPATVEQGHAAIRFTNPTTGGDVMPTIRCEFHRSAPASRRLSGTRSAHRCGRSSRAADRSSSAAPSTALEKGDLFVVPELGAVVAARRDRRSTSSASTTDRSSTGSASPAPTSRARTTADETRNPPHRLRPPSPSASTATRDRDPRVRRRRRAPRRPRVARARRGGRRSRRSACADIADAELGAGRPCSRRRSSASVSTTATTSSRWAASCPSSRPSSPSTPRRWSARTTTSRCRTSPTGPSTGRRSSRS